MQSTEKVVLTDQMYQKWFVKFRAADFSLEDAPWLGTPVEVNSDHGTLIENNQCYTTRGIANTQNIQINKVIGKNEKCVFYFMEKLNRLFGQPNINLIMQLVKNW